MSFFLIQLLLILVIIRPTIEWSIIAEIQIDLWEDVVQGIVSEQVMSRNSLFLNHKRAYKLLMNRRTKFRHPRMRTQMRILQFRHSRMRIFPYNTIEQQRRIVFMVSKLRNHEQINYLLITRSYFDRKRCLQLPCSISPGLMKRSIAIKRAQQHTTTRLLKYFDQHLI